jgi:hypothetical protein
MKTLSIAVLAAGLAAGCQANKVTQVAPEARESIAYAATAKYPGSPQTSSRYQLVALDDPNAREVTVYNLTNDPIPAKAIWVNRTYVRRGSPIGARGHTVIPYGSFLEAAAPSNDFSKASQPVSRVDLQTDDGLYAVLGPGLR